MKIKIHYFASLREKIGRATDQLETTESLTTRQAWEQITGLPDLLDNLLIAVNQEYCTAETILKDGDELAFFPLLQVVKLSVHKIEIIDKIFDPWQAQKAYQTETMQGAANYGATASFIGTMRDFNDGDDVVAMTLEHYPQMTEKQLGIIIASAESKWPIQNTLIIHRVGEILPGEPIMLVAVWSAHRAAAFDACRYLMEALKHRAPFWKKEQLVSGDSRWVEKNTDGHE